MVKASVFPGTPRAGYGPRRATLQEDRPGAYRDRRTLPTRELQTAPTSVLCVRRGHERPRASRHHRQASACARRTRPARPGQLQTTGRGAKTRRIHAARPGNTSGFRGDAPLRDQRRAPGKRRRRKRPQTSFSPCLRPAARPPCPALLPSPMPGRKILAAQTFSEHPSL